MQPLSVATRKAAKQQYDRMYYQSNKEHIKAQVRAYAQRNRVKVRAQNRDYSRKNLSLFTPAEYAERFLTQGGRFAICLVEVRNRSLHADHCHATGIKRGLLCMPCNTALGAFRENPEVLRRALSYIEQYLAP